MFWFRRRLESSWTLLDWFLFLVCSFLGFFLQCLHPPFQPFPLAPSEEAWSAALRGKCKSVCIRVFSLRPDTRQHFMHMDDTSGHAVMARMPKYGKEMHIVSQLQSGWKRTHKSNTLFDCISPHWPIHHLSAVIFMCQSKWKDNQWVFLLVFFFFKPLNDLWWLLTLGTSCCPVCSSV